MSECKMEFKKCEPCLLVEKYKPGITISGEKVGNYILMCLATGKTLEITECIKKEA